MIERHFFSEAFGFFYWVGLCHFVNLLMITLLMRSGLEILSAHPRLYFNDGCAPGSQWISFTRKRVPRDRLYTSTDDEVGFSPWIALPGRMNLGMGRHWHFFCAIFWMLNGVIYVAGLLLTGGWTRLIPASWSIFPRALHTAFIYAGLHLPPRGDPYNPLQQLSYAAMVFVLAPMMIASGAAMSPAIAARFPGYIRIFGGRQTARSIHFLGLCGFLAFLVVHVTMVCIEDFPYNMAYIIHGAPVLRGISVAIGVAGLVAIVIIHVIATRISLRDPRAVQRWLGYVVEPVRRATLHHLDSRQEYRPDEITPYFWSNGRPPVNGEFAALSRSGFKDWRLRVTGLVDNPLTLSLDDLRAMPPRLQITKHNCIQGWSGVAKWTGAAVADVIARARPRAQARYVVFRAYQEEGSTADYYEVLDLELARHHQTILAYDMNDAPLPSSHGAPCRLRCETQLGFKMVKYLREIELVEDYRSIGAGQGGFREDTQFYGPEAGI